MSHVISSTRTFILCGLIAAGCLAASLLEAEEVGRVTGGSLVSGFPGPVNGCRFTHRSTYNTWSRNSALLGNPISNEQVSTRSSTGATGTFMLCERGTMMRIATGRYAGITSVVRGGIGAKYSDFGGPAGVLGYPINDERNINAAGHDQQLFERGFIQWSDALGDFAVQTY
jgi:uncharacterized protein with LGFP repeats